MREMHLVIYEGLPTDKEVPIQISFASVLEAVIEQSKQYLHSPQRPDYSKETYDKLMELVSTVPNLWVMDREEIAKILA